MSELWARFLLQSHQGKKIALVYLANDLIQKSLLEPQQLDFHASFRPLLGPVLLQLFGDLRSLPEKQI